MHTIRVNLAALDWDAGIKHAQMLSLLLADGHLLLLEPLMRRNEIIMKLLLKSVY